MSEVYIDLMACFTAMLMLAWVGFECLNDYLVVYLKHQHYGKAHWLACSVITLLAFVIDYVMIFNKYNEHYIILSIMTVTLAVIVCRYVHYYYRRIKLFKDSSRVFSDESVEVTVVVSEPSEEEDEKNGKK